MTLGEYIKETRLNKGMNQTQFGEFVGVSYVSINHLENKNTCGLQMLRKLSKALGVPIKDLRSMMNNEDNE